MTPQPELTAEDIPLKALSLHPVNARAQNGSVYADDDIDALAASIATLGLLNPLIVQRTEDGWGVLAGGRRLAAMQMLQKDKARKAWKTTTPVPCRVIDAALAITSAITLAENVTQKPMDPIDEFEAYAAILDAGQDVASIARTFGQTERHVSERLRYGRVHPDIRAAARTCRSEGGISLDMMKAYATHPDQEVQIAVYRDLTAGDAYVTPYTVQNTLKSRGVKLADPKAVLVIDDYKARGGAITPDLIEADSVLDDPALVDELLEAKLCEMAEEERAALGFAWCDVMIPHDWSALAAYGRIYPGHVEPEGKDAVRAEAIADRFEAIEAAFEDEGLSDEDYEALETEHDALRLELERLTTAWTEDDLARSGIILSWQNGEITRTAGLVRKEDAQAKGPNARGDDADGTSTGTSDGPQELTLADSLIRDLRIEQAMALGAALADAPALAMDLLHFKIASDMLGSSGNVSYEFRVTAQHGDRSHGKPDEIDPRATEAVAALHAALDLSWWEAGSVPARFEAFRALATSMKVRIVAVALADCIAPASHGVFTDDLLTHVAQEALPDIRSLWRPTGEAFFKRLKKADLIAILADDLGMAEEAGRLVTATKAQVVAFMETLFAEGFATMTDDQRSRVAAWCPPGMAIPMRESDASTDGETGTEDGESAPASSSISVEANAEAAPASERATEAA